MIKYNLCKVLADSSNYAANKLYDLTEYLRDIQLAELNKALADAEFSKETNALFNKVFG
jgi:hypothetical protein